MSTLDRTLRKKLSDTIITARKVAEEASADAVRRLGIIEDEAPAYLTPDQKALRVRLRAHARTLGDQWNAEKKKLLTTKQLEIEAAYQIWHRMLFGRFLVERRLLIHPDLGVPVAPSELADLAREAGEPDPWALVERFAAPSLPAVFKPGDPVLAMTLDPALAKRLRDMVAGFPVDVFTADDSLGWTYQFWRTAEKDAVNRAGGKIGAAELPAVTQLFTEPYMVKFLLHNTLGAWWAGKMLRVNPALARAASDERTLRDACSLPGVEWEYLRFVRDGEGKPWRPAAGSFAGWPSRAAEITYCDPCCGSGHFLVEAFAILAALRQSEEGLSADAASCAVLRDNLFGLELDGRCVQIAAFAVALAAWKAAGGVIPLPAPHIAWVGAPPPMSKTELVTLADGDAKLTSALIHLHDQFSQAPLLGTLIEIRARDLLDPDLQGKGLAALLKLGETETERAEGVIAAKGLFEALKILSSTYTLLTTNVPFLARVRQNTPLADYIESTFARGKADLATAMLERFFGLSRPNGTVAVVTPQNWLFQDYYTKFRSKLLDLQTFNLNAALGSRAFEGISGEVVGAVLVIYSQTKKIGQELFATLNVSDEQTASEKSQSLITVPLVVLDQATFAKDKKRKISFEHNNHAEYLSDYATFHLGICTGDYERFGRKFCEIDSIGGRWELQQTTTSENGEYRGYENAVLWEGGCGSLFNFVDERLDGNSAAWLRGKDAWGRKGILVSATGELHVSLYEGNLFDSNSVVVIPKRNDLLATIWRFMSDRAYPQAVRAVSRALKVQGDLIRVGFDLNEWEKAADTCYPSGLPEPSSDDPTQWLFHGHPAHADRGTEIHVALARVCGYQWPAEVFKDIRLSSASIIRVTETLALPASGKVGCVSLHPSSDNLSLADRIRSLLSAAYGAPLIPQMERDLIKAADLKIDKRESKDSSLEAWLRDRAFRQHTVLFRQRPFLWQIWDGLSDGFSAFLHYHQLDRATLEKVTFTLLGDWIARMRAESKTAHENRALQLQQRLRLILEGEEPYDIFVRWKSLEEQRIGWHPDIDDGVRLNIRPFVVASVLRDQPRINWSKDRGSDLPSAPWYHLGPRYGGKEGDRINDHHLTLAEKHSARGQAVRLAPRK